MNIRKLLEQQNWPDGRSLTPQEKDMVIDATSFLPPETKLVQRLFCIYADIDHAPKCSVCGGENKRSRKHLYPENKYSGWSLYCSKECTYKSEDRKNKFTQSMISNHGVPYSGCSPELLKKSQDTLEEKRGVRFALQSKEGQNNFTSTMKDRYGASYAMSSPILKPKIDQTNLTRWGTIVPISNPVIREKATASIIENVGVFPPMKNPAIARKVAVTNTSEESITILESKEALQGLYQSFDGCSFSTAKTLGVHSATINKYLNVHGIEIKNSSISRGEKEVVTFIESLGVTVQPQHRIGRKSVDILIPDHNLVVEYNGIYFHSTEFRDKNFHKERYLMCKENGLRLINIWEDEWEDPIKREIVKTKIKIVLGCYDGEKVFARKCSVRNVKFKEVSKLLQQHHIQGATHGTSYIGLFNDECIVGCMVMKDKKDGVWELARFCTDGMVVGGFSKLMSFFKNNFEWNKVVSFADVSVSDGGVYHKNGFTLEHHTPPVMWYCKGSERFRRERFMKHKLPSIFGNVDMAMTEKDIMKQNGYNQLYDAGLLKYVLLNS